MSLQFLSYDGFVFSKVFFTYFFTQKDIEESKSSTIKKGKVSESLPAKRKGPALVVSTFCTLTNSTSWSQFFFVGLKIVLFKHV